MRKRTSYRGEFWGCANYPTCKGTRDIGAEDRAVQTSFEDAKRQFEASEDNPANDPVSEEQEFGENFDWSAPPKEDPDWTPPPARLTPAQMMVTGSVEQDTFWHFLKHGKSHGMLKAAAGTGKTFSIVQGALRLQDSGLKLAAVAFNKHIMIEGNERLKLLGVDWCRFITYNSLGFQSVRRAFPNVSLVEDKLDSIVGQFISENEPFTVFKAVRDLARLCKCYMMDGRSRAELEAIADKHDVDTDKSILRIAEVVPQVLAECLKQTQTCDFDDQIWWAVKMGLPVEQFDILMIDEFQDTNKMQQEFALLTCPEGRIIPVGDDFQAIYGFRGADSEAMPQMLERLSQDKRGCSVFPLTITRRCPRVNVQMAQAINPDIRALDDAPLGVIKSMSKNAAVDIMRPGDLVLCRINRALIPVCYALIRKGVKATIRGRDISKGILALVQKLRAFDCCDLLRKLESYRASEADKLEALGKKGQNRLMALNDRCDCIIELCEGINTVSELKGKINQIFSEFETSGKPKEAVVLCTVHRGKGLEANHVFVLEPELIPHPMASQPWEQKQEKHIAYIAITRTKFIPEDPGLTVFVGAIPPIYNYKLPEQTEEGYPKVIDGAFTVVKETGVHMIEQSFLDDADLAQFPASTMANLSDPETVRNIDAAIDRGEAEDMLHCDPKRASMSAEQKKRADKKVAPKKKVAKKAPVKKGRK